MYIYYVVHNLNQLSPKVTGKLFKMGLYDEIEAGYTNIFSYRIPIDESS